jgi:hypothetical protein
MAGKAQKELSDKPGISRDATLILRLIVGLSQK